MMDKFETKCFNLFDRMIESRIDEYGLRWTIQWLTDEGFTVAELIKLGFDEIDIADALNADN